MARPPIRRRLVLLATLAAAGGVLFLPFLAAGAPQSVTALGGFAVAVTVVATLAAWPGLRCADAVGLPMPFLRAVEGVPHHPLRRDAVPVTLALSVVLGAVGVAALRLVHAPALPGSAGVRALSAVFAAGALEIVVHLGLMSVVVWLARGRRWVGIVVAALALVGFHLTGGGLDQPAALLAIGIVGNGTIGLALGWVYAEYGFELVIVGHAAAHLITVLLA